MGTRDATGRDWSEQTGGDPLGNRTPDQPTAEQKPGAPRRVKNTREQQDAKRWKKSSEENS